MEAVDKHLVTPSMLDAPLEPAQSVQASLDGFAQERSPEYLSDVDLWLDRLLDEFRLWPFFSISSEVGSHVIEGLEREGISAIGRLRDQVGEASEAAANVLAAVETVRAEADSSVSAVEQQAQAFTNAVEARVAELIPTIEAQKARLDSAITEFQAQFSASEETRRQAAEVERRALTAEVDEWLATQRKFAEVASLEVTQTAQTLLGQIEGYRAQAVKVTQAIGVAGMAEGFRADADEQKSNADKLRLLAIGSLVMTVLATLWAAATTDAGRFDAGTFIARSVLAAAIASVGAYAIIQSQQHRQRERSSRKLAIEFASIDPYLALMPEEDQIAVKKKLAESWFGQPIEPMEVTGDGKISSIPVATFIEALVKLGSK